MSCHGCDAWHRRDVLRTLAALGAVGCMDPSALETGNEPSCAPEFDPSDPSWHEFLFADYPELLDEDGWTTLKEPSLLLDILVARTPDTCLVALWRICSHGACPLSWYPKQEHARCGCHGSRFDTEGRVLNGPATAPIRTFPTAQTETSFWIYRPL